MKNYDPLVDNEQLELQTEEERWAAEIKLRQARGDGRRVKRLFYLVLWASAFATAIMLDAYFFPNYSVRILFP